MRTALITSSLATSMLLVGGAAISGPPASSSTAFVTFQGLGDLPGGRTESCAIAVSTDGRVIAGWSASEHGNRAFRWTDGEMTELTGDGIRPLVGHALSADGAVVVGVAEQEAKTVAFRWKAGVASALTAPAGDGGFGDAWGISTDGLTAVGNITDSGKSEIAVWNSRGFTSMKDMGDGGGSWSAAAVSGNGEVVVGHADSELGPEAAAWHSRTLQRLGVLPGGEHRSEARAITRDGAVIVGASTSAKGFEAVMWRGGEISALGGLSREHEFLSTAQGVSDDGGVIVGFAIDDRDTPQAVVWDSINGIRSLRAMLVEDFAVDLAGWRLESANGVSGDGRTIVGCGRNPRGQPEGWMARLPENWWGDNTIPFRERSELSVETKSASSDASSPTEPRRDAAPRLGRGINVLNGLLEPSGASFDSQGNIWVADSGHNAIRMFDAQGTLKRNFGSPGSGLHFDAPHDVAVSNDGTIYVADTGNHRVQALFPDGRLRRSWGGQGTDPCQFLAPQGIASRHGRIYVADTGNDRIEVFDEHGAFIQTFGCFGHGDGELDNPEDLAVDEQGRVYVADTGNDRIAVFSADGGWETAWGERGSAPRLFNRPTGVEVRGGVVYVVDQVNHRVQVFNRDGSLRYLWGREVLRPHEVGGRIAFPARIAVSDDDTRAVVCELSEDRCQTFGMIEETTVASLSPPDSSSAFYDALPLTQAIGTMHVGGDVLVTTNDANGYVLVYRLTDHDPILVTKVGTPGHGVGQLADPRGLWFDAETSRLFVADSGNHRIEAFEIQLSDAGATKFVPNLARLGRSIEIPSRETDVHSTHRSSRPDRLALAPDGAIAIIDQAVHRVLLLNKDLQVIREVGGPPDSMDELHKPVDVAFTRDGAQLLVLNAGRPGVVAFDRDGTYIRAWGTMGENDGEFLAPAAIHTGLDGYVYVSDRAANRVQKFNEVGRFITKWGRMGVGAGEFFKPADIAQDAQGRIYVNDRGNRRIQVFDADGQFLLAIGSPLSIHPTLSK